MKAPRQVMPVKTAELFLRLRRDRLLRPFVLIGGTGLALHLGHRRSEDLDFITRLPRLPRLVLKELEQKLQSAGHSIIHKDDSGAYDDFLNAGMDVRDYSQNWLVDNEVKLTFFTAESHHEKLLEKTAEKAGFRVGSLHELSQLKAVVATSRSKSRDWLDLYILAREHHFGLAQWKQAYDKAGLTSLHFETALNRICSGKIPEGDEGYTTLMADPPSLESIVAYFRATRTNYEVEMAKRFLKKDISSAG